MRENNLQSRLAKLGSHVLGASAAKKQLSESRPIPERYRKLSTALGGQTTERTAGTFCLVDTPYTQNYTHGSFGLADIASVARIPAAALTRDKREEQIPIESLRFIDTETTGLGGSGTIPFLIGVARVINGTIHVRQFFLPDYSDEAGMLEAVCAELEGESVFVSYNGLSFDLPLLQSRCILNRVASDAFEKEHFDLLYPSRRLFKRRLKDCSLQNIERMILGFERFDDIPGYLIPTAYFDWLSEETTDQLVSVVEHNRLDIVSLVFLAAFFSEIFASEGEPLEEIDDIHSLSRTYSGRGEREITHRLFTRIEALKETELADDLILFHATNCRRLGNYADAVRLWRKIVSAKSKIGGIANIELAKYYEHVEPDIETALRFARAAGKNSYLTTGQQAALEKRLFRLESKRKSGQS